VPAGGVAILEVLRVPKDGYPNGMYEFSDPDPLKDVNKITISVTCGHVTTVIYVRIILKPEDVRVTATLQKNSIDFPNSWGDTDSLDMKYFFIENGADYGKIQYRVALKFYIWDQLIFDTTQNASDYNYFDYNDLYGFGGTINLWHNTANANPNLIDSPRIYPGDTTNFDFQVWCNFGLDKDGNSVRYYTSENFRLVIITWSQTF